MLNLYEDINKPIKEMNDEVRNRMQSNDEFAKIDAMLKSGDINQNRTAIMIISATANEVVDSYVKQHEMTAEQIKKISMFIRDSAKKARVAQRQIACGISLVHLNAQCEIAVADSFMEKAPKLLEDIEKKNVEAFAAQDGEERLAKLKQNNKKLAKYQKMAKKNPEKASKLFAEFAEKELEGKNL